MASSSDDVMPEHLRLRWSCLLARIFERFDALNKHVTIMDLMGRLVPGDRRQADRTLEQQMCPHPPAYISPRENQHASWGKCLKCMQRIYYFPITHLRGTDEFHSQQLNKQVLLEVLGVITADGPEPVVVQAVGPEPVTSFPVDGPQLLHRRSALSLQAPGQAESQRPSGPRSGVALIGLTSWCRACWRALMPRRSSHP